MYDPEAHGLLLLVAGASGTGKTALAMQIAKKVQHAGGFFAQGKWDLEQRDAPYAGIAAACAAVGADILSCKDQETNRRASRLRLSFDEMQGRLRDGLQQEIDLLGRVIPNLQLLVGGGPSVNADPGDSAYADAKNLFNYAFRRFIRLASTFGPLVLTLDDLQWADLPSLELIETLLGDRVNPPLMIIGTYRSNEVSKTHPLSQMISYAIKEASDQGKLTEVYKKFSAGLKVSAVRRDDQYNLHRQSGSRKCQPVSCGFAFGRYLRAPGTFAMCPSEDHGQRLLCDSIPDDAPRARAARI